ncbi:Uncharacterized protein TCM_025018 [Theobroma cacao]|uniref:Uncharacterized protein n=1 Tax=Theobroma cacao TaxID=3641 RepID=A0A061EWY2_THECC|nr:Uncharacterized protein TCM_025018 [Theobroma cacao]
MKVICQTPMKLHSLDKNFRGSRKKQEKNAEEEQSYDIMAAGGKKFGIGENDPRGNEACRMHVSPVDTWDPSGLILYYRF